MGTERRRPVIGITLDIEADYLRLRRNYASVIKNAGGIPLLIPCDNEAASVAEIIDGLLIPGGDDLDPSYFSEEPHPLVKITQKDRTGFELLLLKAIMELGKPVLGICYGMQLINVAFGGSLYQDIESQIKGAIDHRKGSHSIKMAQGSRFKVQGSEVIVNSFHHQAVRELGAGLEVCAVSEDNIVEAVFMPAYPFLAGIQWHPERLDDVFSRDIFKSFIKSAYACK